MGLLDDLAGAAKGAIEQAVEGGMVQNTISQMVSSAEHGGLDGILAKLNESGLGQQVSSWASGAGLPVTGDQIRAALGDAHLDQMAQSMGVPIDSIINGLAEHLPAIVAKR